MTIDSDIELLTGSAVFNNYEYILIIGFIFESEPIILCHSNTVSTV